MCVQNKETKAARFTAQAQAAFLGLALGDALGTTLEFKSKDSYAPLTDMVGGGPFRLNPGEWTDDTSMALCLAESLLAVGDHDAKDQIERYFRWREQGENSVKGYCFDIGNTVSSAIDRYLDIGDPNAGSEEAYTAGNGSLMRLVPVVIFFSTVKGYSLSALLEMSAASSVVTHAEQRAVQGCQIMAYLIDKVFNGCDDKSVLFGSLAAQFSHVHSDFSSLVSGAFLSKSRDEINGTGFVVDALEAALWCFAHSDDFAEGALLAANLGDDADTTAAIYGQLAGAFYSLDGLPQDWLEKLAWREKITDLGRQLALKSK